MKITDFFDKIYFLNLIDNSERRDFFIEQTKILGIYDELNSSDKFEIVESVKIPFLTPEDTNILMPSCEGKTGLMLCTFEHFKIMKRALYNGYKHILIIEDDICFNKDLDFLLNAIKNAPEDYNLLHLEGFYWPNDNDDYEHLLSMLDDKHNAKWKSSEEQFLWDTGSIAYSKQGMEDFCNTFTENRWFCDYITGIYRNKAYFYSYPLMIQENSFKSNISSSNEGKNSTNFYQSKINYDDFFKYKNGTAV